MRRTIIAGGIAIALAIGAQAQLLNGGFESPDISPATQATYPPGSYIDGWTVSGGNFGLYQNGWDAHPNAVIAGNQTGYFPVSGTSISQDVVLSSSQPVVLGGLYFSAAMLDGLNSYSLDYAISAPSWGSSVSGTVIGSAVAPNADSYWIDLTGYSLGAGETLTIAFTSQTDNVAIDEVGLEYTVVPEPHLYALAAGLGLMAFAGYRRWRRA